MERFIIPRIEEQTKGMKLAKGCIELQNLLYRKAANETAE